MLCSIHCPAAWGSVGFSCQTASHLTLNTYTGCKTSANHHSHHCGDSWFDLFVLKWCGQMVFCKCVTVCYNQTSPLWSCISEGYCSQCATLQTQEKRFSPDKASRQAIFTFNMLTQACRSWDETLFILLFCFSDLRVNLLGCTLAMIVWQWPPNPPQIVGPATIASLRSRLMAFLLGIMLTHTWMLQKQQTSKPSATSRGADTCLLLLDFVFFKTLSFRCDYQVLLHHCITVAG